MGRQKTTGRTCRFCGATEAEGAVISYRRQCQKCSLDRYEESVRQIARREGPFFERWVENMDRAVRRAAGGGVPRDQRPATRRAAS